MRATSSVLRLDPDDELPAILDRLPARTPCVLVLPPHARALTSVVGAKLLSRRARTLDSAIAVVTDDHAMMAHARAAGVPVAQTVEEAQGLLGAAPAGAAREAARADRAFRRGKGARSVHPAEPDAAHDDAGPAAGASHGAPRPPWDLGRAAERPDLAHDGHPPVVDTGLDTDLEAIPALGPDAPTMRIRGHSSGTDAARGRSSVSLDAAARAGAYGPDLARRWARPIGRAAPVILLLLLLGGLALYILNGLLNPTATLTLHPRAGIITADTTVRAVLNLPFAQRGSQRLAMATISQSERHTVPVPVRGTKILPGYVAAGHLSLANLTTRPLVVPAGTTFTTARNRASFVSTVSITLPAATETFSAARYGTGVVPIQAALGGTSGNVPARSIVNVPAAFTGKIKVQNPAPTRGGTNRHERVVTPHDLAVAAARLFGVLELRARRDIVRRRGDVEQHTVFVARAPVGPRLAPDRRSARLTLSVVVHAVYVHRQDLVAAATAALQQALASHPGVRLIRPSVTAVATWRP
ncbi:MAG TPA: baseplate J/gp47 family protein, partial [Chloroflexota bacterium]|nr:baseplate J/gp47 family protein [Chloroflexota bacterium]